MVKILFESIETAYKIAFSLQVEDKWDGCSAIANISTEDKDFKIAVGSVDKSKWCLAGESSVLLELIHLTKITVNDVTLCLQKENLKQTASDASM